MSWQRRYGRAKEQYRQLSEQSRTFTPETDEQGLYTWTLSELVLGYRRTNWLHETLL